MQTAVIEAIGEDLIVEKKLKYLELYIDKSNQWVYADWIGTPTVEEVKEGLENILLLFSKYDLGKILHDHRKLKGTWTGAMNWIISDWTPRAVAAGYSAVAFIYSKDVFGKFSVDQLLKLTDEESIVKQKPFREIKEAKAWLSSY